jgi:IS605 OrfB family transposase
MLKTYRFLDPLIFEKDGELYISLAFDVPEKPCVPIQACGVDLGIRVAAATSDGILYVDKKYNAEKRRLRFRKRKLQSKRTKSAKRSLKKIRHKEANKTENQTHHLANAILRGTDSNVIALEDLSGLKKRKVAFKNLNRISQVPFSKLLLFLSYKAPLAGKMVITVDPSYTSQIDHRTNAKSGVRKGRRYYGADGVVLDADINAAINIAKRSKHPVPHRNVLDGQATVKSPIVGARRLTSPRL